MRWAPFIVLMTLMGGCAKTDAPASDVGATRVCGAMFGCVRLVTAVVDGKRCVVAHTTHGSVAIDCD